MSSTDKVRIAQRIHVTTKVEFYVDEDVINGESVDFSETGIRFETESPLQFRVRFEHAQNETEDGNVYEREAELVWAKTEVDGCMTYGLRFISDIKAKSLNSKISSDTKDNSAWG